MGNIRKFSGTTTHDILPNDVLLSAIDELKEVIVVGIDKSGKTYYAMSHSSIPDALFLVEHFKNDLLCSDEET